MSLTFQRMISSVVLSLRCLWLLFVSLFSVFCLLSFSLLSCSYTPILWRCDIVTSDVVMKSWHHDIMLSGISCWQHGIMVSYKHSVLFFYFPCSQGSSFYLCTSVMWWTFLYAFMFRSFASRSLLGIHMLLAVACTLTTVTTLPEHSTRPARGLQPV